MSRTDFFSKYSQIYAKARAREIVPGGPFVRQFVDIPRNDLDIGIFFKSKKKKIPRQVHIGNPIPLEVAEQEGFLETEESTYFSRTLISNIRSLQYLRVVIGAGQYLEERDARIAFLKKCQRIIDVLLRKVRNVVHLGDFTSFRFYDRVNTLQNFFRDVMKLDDIAVEAASIPFNMASPEYVILTGNEIVVTGDEPSVPHGIFHFVGGIGYIFDKKTGAISEERLFRTTEDLSSHGIDEAYIDSMISRVTEDFQTNLHSIIFSDVWKKSQAKPVGVNFGGDLLIKAEPSSEIWTGVFEVYVAPPKTT